MRRLLWLLLILPFLAPAARGQAEIPHFASDPPTCDPTRGLLYYNTITQQVKSCTALNTWTSVANVTPAVGRIVTGTTDTITAADCTLQMVVYRNTGAGGVTVTVPTATSLGNSGCDIILQNATIPGAPVTVNFTSWLANSAFCAPSSGSPCSSLQFGQNQQIVITPEPAGGAWKVQPGGMVNGVNLGTAVTVTDAASLPLPFDTKPQTFVTDFFIQLTTNTTITGVTGPFVQGNEIVVTFVQGSPGGFTVAWPANFLNPPVLQTANGAYTAVTFQYCGAAGNGPACPAGDWQNTDIGPAGAFPTLDAVLQPINPASFTFPVGATTGLTLLGTNQASSGAGVAGNQLVSATAPNGGDCTNTGCTAGVGGPLSFRTGNGGTSFGNAGVLLGAGGIETHYLGSAGKSTNGPGSFSSWGLFNVDANSNDNARAASGATWINANFPIGSAPGRAAGIWARNINSTQGNTLNNTSPVLGLSAHMQLNSVDTEALCAFMLYPGFPTSSNMSLQTGNNPELTVMLECPNNAFSPYYHFMFMQGGPVLDTNNGGSGVGGDGWLWNPGGRFIIGMDPFGNRASSAVYFGTNATASQMDIVKCFRGNGGCVLGTGNTKMAAGEGTDGAANGSWVYTQAMTNSSGATINDGSPVKMGTANQVTPTVTTDTGANIVLGVNIGTCLSGAVCNIAWGGRLLGVMLLGTGTCAVGNAIIVDTTTNQRIKCIAAGSATFGTVIGMAESVQNSVGSAVDVSIRIH